MVGIKFADFMGYAEPEIHCILRYNVGQPFWYLRFPGYFVNSMNVNTTFLFALADRHTLSHTILNTLVIGKSLLVSICFAFQFIPNNVAIQIDIDFQPSGNRQDLV